MRRADRRLRHIDPPRVLLWVPLLSALAGLVILTALDLAAPLYLVILVTILIFDLLALFGPRALQRRLLDLAPTAYVVLLLSAWVGALYVLPDHPATPMALLTSVLHVTTLYVFFFVREAPRRAALQAALTLGLFVLSALPHSWRSLGQQGAFDGVTLPLTLLFAHSALILVLLSFSRSRVELAQAQARAQALHDLAHRDPLTDLHNRRALEQDLDRLAQARRPGWLLAVVDVDGLKRVNDTLGHAAGDDLLRRFAAGFAQAAGPQGRAYRLSGDEFALRLRRGARDAERVVDDVTREVRLTYPDAGASVGTALWREGETPSAWLSRADHAMYRHKKRTQEEAPPSTARGSG